MTPEDRDRMVRIEMGLESVHDKLDNLILPSCNVHAARIGRMERIMEFAGGAIFIVSGIAFVAREVLVEWLKKKVGAN